MKNTQSRNLLFFFILLFGWIPAQGQAGPTPTVEELVRMPSSEFEKRQEELEESESDLDARFDQETEESENSLNEMLGLDDTAPAEEKEGERQRPSFAEEERTRMIELNRIQERNAENEGPTRNNSFDPEP